MMHYYADIIGNRRDADRLYWQRRRASKDPIGAAYETAITDDCPQQTEKTPPMLDVIREAAVTLLVAKGIIPISRVDDLFIEIGEFDTEESRC